MRHIIDLFKRATSRITVAPFLFGSVMLIGCAVPYHKMHPERAKYDSTEASGEIKVKYRYHVLRDFKNRRYEEHAYFKKVKVVALAVTNNTGHTINLARDAEFTVKGVKALPLSPKKIPVRQYAPLYFISHLPWLLWDAPTGQYIYFSVATFNATFALISNHRLKRDLQRYSIDRDIRPGKTEYFIVSFKGIKVFGPIEISLRSR